MTTPGSSSHSTETVVRPLPRRYRPTLVPGHSAALIFFVAVFWLFLAMRLQEVDLSQAPAWWLAQVQSFPLLAFVPAPFVTFFSELFSWHVFRHIFIPAVLGWWLAGEAAVGFVRDFYNFPSRAEAAGFLARLEGHGRHAAVAVTSAPTPAVAPAPARPGGRTRLGPALKLAMIMAPMALTFFLLLVVSPFLPASPTRTILYNALIVVSGAATAIAVAYFALDTFTGGGPPAAPGLRLHRDTLETMRRDHALLRVGGPGRIVVPHSDVVVTEYNARFHRVLGPGAQTLQPFEYVRSILDLRPQEREGDVTGFTRDGVEVACHIAVTFRLSSDDRYVNGGDPSAAAQSPTRDRPYPFGERAVRAAAYIETIDGEGRVSSWTSLPLVVAMGQFRRALSIHPLDTLYDPQVQEPSPHPLLWQQVQNKTRDSLREAGIELIALRMGSLQPPPEVLRENLSGWRSYWDNLIHRRHVEGRVDAVHTVEDARTKAAVDMLRTIIQSIQDARYQSNVEIAEEIIALRLLEGLERAALAAEQAAQDSDPQVQRQLSAIRQGLLPSGSGEPSGHDE